MNKNSQQVLVELNEKFNSNFSEWMLLKDHKLEKSFLGLQCIAAVGEVLQGRKASKHHDICCKIFDEIFSDGVAATYLASTAMDKPACTVLRRVLELGVAAIYLWDMPHMATAWEQQGQDLSFSEMLKHVNSKGYIAYVSHENDVLIANELVPAVKAQDVYGALSDIVHGKISTFETSMPNRFKFVACDWGQFVVLLDEVVEMLVSAYFVRFNVRREAFAKVPRAKREFS